MTIASAIVNKQQQVAACYTAISNKGGTLPVTQDVANMPTAIASIPSGGGVSIPREVKNGVYQVPTESFTFSFPSTATTISAYALCYAFYGSTGLTGSVDLSNVTSVGTNGLYYAFYRCTGLTGSVNLSNVTSIGDYALQYAFRGCTGITGVDLSNATSVAAYGLESAFNSCTGLTGSIDLSSVTSIAYRGSYQIFQNCTGITSVDLSSVISIAAYGFQYAFYDCKKLQVITFNSLKTTSFGNVNAFSSMFSTTTGSEATGGCTVHFPSNLQSTISGLTGYPTFGGSSSYIQLAFDLPATS